MAPHACPCATCAAVPVIRDPVVSDGPDFAPVVHGTRWPTLADVVLSMRDAALRSLAVAPEFIATQPRSGDILARVHAPLLRRLGAAEAAGERVAPEAEDRAAAGGGVGGHVASLPTAEHAGECL